MQYFHELDVSTFNGATLIIDVDGTIAIDSSPHVDERVGDVLRRLSLRNAVYLCSNGRDGARVHALGERFGVVVLDTPHRKPNRKIADAIRGIGSTRVVVIGDKYITDGMLARNIGAEFVRVKRIVHERDRFFVRLTNMIDDAYRAVHPFILLLRPSHWVKNVLVFAPAFFSGTLSGAGVISNGLLAWVAFSATASSVYVFNDLIDRDRDRRHPRKRYRPLPNGDIGPFGATLLLCLSLAAVFATLFAIPSTTAALLSYGALNVLYSYRLKYVAFIDVVCIAFFHVLRVVVGSYAMGIPVSPWLYITVFFGSMIFAIGKRIAIVRNALPDVAPRAYSDATLGTFMQVCAMLTVASFVAYCTRAASPQLILSLVFLIPLIVRVLSLIRKEHTAAEFPERMLFSDATSVLLLALWVVTLSALIYL